MPDTTAAQVESQTGQARTYIMLTLLGGVLLASSLVAIPVFEQDFYPEILAMAAAILLGIPLIVRAARDLWRGDTHFDELVALGVIAAFASQMYLSAGIIAFFMIIATLIEHRTALGARRSIESLVKLTPTRAHKLTDSGEVEVDAKELQAGDVVRVRPGDNIPGDGEITSGSSTVNQANITGESLPADKNIGEEVFGGTVNLTGVLDVRITKAGRDTTLGRVQDLILQAEQTRAPIARIIDRYSKWYTPVILMLAFIVWWFTGEIERAISMLIVACPLAIILSTPTAMVAALSAAARLGVLVKNVTDLEVARNLTAVMFDKTGTLTTGKLVVTKLTPAPGVEGADLLTAAASAEHSSKHPVAQAVVDVARKARLDLPDPDQFEEVSGRGVRAAIGGSQILVGRFGWIKDQEGVDLSELDTSAAEGLSLLYVVRDGKPLGWVGLEDQTRPDARRAMDELRDRLSIKQLVMVTGDRWSVAKRVASEMHCTNVQAEVLPGQKLDLVSDLRQRGHTLAVIGDGVNDAPALAAGDISIAMGAAGSDVAIHSASIALMNNNLNRVPFLIRLSRETFSVIRQNLTFAVVYVIVFEALSAAGLLPPIAAAALHAASSFVVIFNSARLVRTGEEIEQAEAAGGGEEPPRRRPAPTPAPVTPAPA